MSDPFIGEIRAFANIYTPDGWLQCNGSIRNVRDFQALFMVIGNRYGGDGMNTFGLPNLNNRIIVGSGQDYPIGASFGDASVILQEPAMPNHNHVMQKKNTTGGAADKTAKPSASSNPAGLNSGTQIYSCLSNVTTDLTALHPTALQPAGSSTPHENRQPFLCLFHAIAYEGVFPTRP